MATPALQELIDLVGEKEADRLYNAILGEYTAHIRKHVDAAKADNPEKVAEAEFIEGVLDRSDGERLHTAIHREIEGGGRG